VLGGWQQMTLTISTQNTAVARSAWLQSSPEWRIDTDQGVSSVWPEPGRTFESERDAFRALLPTLKGTHAGQHVAIQNGVVVDQDPSRRTLLRRFFGGARGNDAVYIGFVGPQRAVRVPTPFFRRP
jgi:hypothetical protein